MRPTTGTEPPVPAASPERKRSARRRCSRPSGQWRDRPPAHRGDAGPRPVQLLASRDRGWAGDTIWVYRHADDPTRTGHVWRLEWDSPADAAEFADAYRRLLETRGAEPVDSAAGVFRIPDGDPFAGAYRVSTTGTTVDIVGAPTVGDLGAIHAATRGSMSPSEPAAALESGATAASMATANPSVAPTVAVPTSTAVADRRRDGNRRARR